ncbi:MAG: hypothetical protein K2X35_05080 [Bryobacteraceae bacterium]|nr:hypothetical protein [Bryobacteraceae bacterium]
MSYHRALSLVLLGGGLMLQAQTLSRSTDWKAAGSNRDWGIRRGNQGWGNSGSYKMNIPRGSFRAQSYRPSEPMRPQRIVLPRSTPRFEAGRFNPRQTPRPLPKIHNLD